MILQLPRPRFTDTAQSCQFIFLPEGMFLYQDTRQNINMFNANEQWPVIGGQWSVFRSKFGEVSLREEEKEP
jgi:hypothetical protein